MLKRLRLTNFGPFAHADLRLGALTVLVGPNNSGKTTLLRALQTFRLATEEGAQSLARPRIGSGGAWSLEADFTGDVTVTLVGPARGYLAKPQMRLGEIVFGEGEGATQALREHGFQSRDTGVFGLLRDRSPTLENPSPEIEAMRKAVSDMRSIRAVALDPGLSRLDSPVSDNWTDWMDRGATEGLPSALASLVADDPAAGAVILAEFTRVFPEFRTYSSSLVAVTGETRSHYRLSFWTRSGAQLSADEVSDGVILHLALLALVHAPRPPSMLLIEEPEAGIHPARLVDLCTILRAFAERTGCQVVLTTHMPYLLDAVQPEEAWFCRRGTDGNATVSCFADLEDLDRELRVRSLGEVWSALGEETLFSRITSP
jgi:predicted ATPase